jgi:hypothetical protein
VGGGSEQNKRPPMRKWEVVALHLRRLMGKLKLTVNEEKTRICKVPKGEFSSPEHVGCARESQCHRLCISAGSPRPFFVTAVTLLPVQKIANGLSGDPVPFSMRSGAAENRNS